MIHLLMSVGIQRLGGKKKAECMSFHYNNFTGVGWNCGGFSDLMSFLCVFLSLLATGGTKFTSPGLRGSLYTSVVVVRYVAPVEGDLHSTTARVSIKGNDWTSPSWHLPFLLSSSHLLLASEGWGVGGRLHLSVPFFCFVFPVPSRERFKGLSSKSTCHEFKKVWRGSWTQIQEIM